jgi:outer membrane protein OmpA-like peptidoglycan-associated protein
MADPVSLDAHGGEALPAAAAPASLFAAVKAWIGGELPRHAARYLGEDEARVLTAMDLLILASLRQLAARSATTEGAARLFGDLGSKRLDVELSAALDRLLVDEPGGLAGQPFPGEEITARHFGRSIGSVVLAVASTTGLEVEEVRQLLVLTTPHVLAALRDYMNAGSLDANALRQRLANEYPKGRWTRRLHRVFSAAAEGTSGASPARSTGRSVRRDRRALALVAVVAVVVALAWPSVDDPAGAPDGAESAAALRHAQPEGGPAPLASHGAAVSGLVEFLSSDAVEAEFVFGLDEVEFEPASATLKSTSNAQLKEIATALAAFPRSRITLEAHADGETEDERELAERRAVAVRAALAVFGVPLSRTNHAGVGDTNRSGHRVEARVTRR